MAASKEDIERWYNRGCENTRYIYMIVIWDRFYNDDYPKYAISDAERDDIVNNLDSMQEHMETYDLRIPLYELDGGKKQ